MVTGKRLHFLLIPLGNSFLTLHLLSPHLSFLLYFWQQSILSSVHPVYYIAVYCSMLYTTTNRITRVIFPTRPRVVFDGAADRTAALLKPPAIVPGLLVLPAVDNHIVKPSVYVRC